jgi:hypothetical protein
MSPTSTPVIELAVYTVRSPDAFPTTQHQMHEALATLSGHRTGLRLRGMSHGLFADLIAWESLEAAQQASNTAREDARFAPLMNEIIELKLYAHYRVGVDASLLLAKLREAPLVEVAAYAVRDPEVHDEAQAWLHEALRATSGHRGGAPARQVEDPVQFADLVGWEHAEAHEHAGATLQQREDLAAFFSGIGAMTVFELFSVLHQA